MKVYVMVYQNDRCEWDAEVDVFTTKDEAQRVMREQYQAAFRRRGCINGYVAEQKGIAVGTIWLKFVMTTTAYMTSGKSTKKS